MIKKVFEQTHDQSKHFEFAATYERIIEDLYIFKLSKNCVITSEIARNAN